MDPFKELDDSLQYQIDDLTRTGYFGQDFIKLASMEEFEPEQIFNQFLFSTPCFIHAVPMKPWQNKSLTGWMGGAA